MRGTKGWGILTFCEAPWQEGICGQSIPDFSSEDTELHFKCQRSGWKLLSPRAEEGDEGLSTQAGETACSPHTGTWAAQGGVVFLLS